MITCLKHKVDFVNGECPFCKSIKDGVSMSYSSSNPEHTSNYNLKGTLERLKATTEKLKAINAEIDKLRKDYNKDKDKE